MIKKYLYLKLCWNRSFSHINIPLSIIDKIVMIAILLKIYDINSPILLSVVGVIFILAMIIIGHLDLKFGIAEKEMSLNNKYNPEIQAILKNGNP